MDVDGGTCWQCGTKAKRIAELEAREVGFCTSLSTLEKENQRLRTALEMATSGQRYGPDDWLLLAEGKSLLEEDDDPMSVVKGAGKRWTQRMKDPENSDE